MIADVVEHIQHVVRFIGNGAEGIKVGVVVGVHRVDHPLPLVLPRAGGVPDDVNRVGKVLGVVLILKAGDIAGFPLAGIQSGKLGEISYSFLPPYIFYLQWLPPYTLS